MSFLAEKEINFTNEKSSDIINHVLKNHHRLLKEELPEIEELVLTIYRVHFEDSGEVLEKVHRLFGRLKIELESHMIQEERSLFYMVKDYKRDQSDKSLKDILEAIERIERLNERVEKILKDLREVTEEYTLLDDTCPTYKKTYNKIQKIERDIKEHFELENMLYNRFKNK
ncbi:MAG TPA: hemerythrin domain-containing protein [Tissierellaceae bacterium]|nr:hemerythrin domain-containing protein [Tissierellaceae bacterium]